MQPGRIAGLLFLLASAMLASSALTGAPVATETVGLALLGSAIAALCDLHLRDRRSGVVLLVVLLLVIGDRLAEHAVAAERLWALPVAFGCYLLWTALTASPRAVMTVLAPALAAIAVPLAFRLGGSEPMATSIVLLPIAAAAATIAALRTRATTGGRALAQNQSDLDAVVMANLELRNVAGAREAADRIARIATELLQADGAVVWLQGPGRPLCAGGHGMTPPPELELAKDSPVGHVLQSGRVATVAGEVVLPLTGSGGVFGAISVTGAKRAAETFVASVLQVFGAQAGSALERLRIVESLVDARFVDPVTGVGNRLAATSSLATLHAGDAVLLLALDSLATIRAIEGEARADLTLGQLGLHLRTALRAGDLVARFGDDMFFVLLRDLDSTAESVVGRILDSWQESGTAGRLRAGAALHFAGTAPLDTLDRAAEALDSVRTDQRTVLAAAAERATWGPA